MSAHDLTILQETVEHHHMERDMYWDWINVFNDMFDELPADDPEFRALMNWFKMYVEGMSQFHSRMMDYWQDMIDTWDSQDYTVQALPSRPQLSNFGL